MTTFQGDPKIFVGPNGAYLKFINGQPVMDGGIENLVTISLLTDPDYWGNDLWDNPDNHIGSEFENEGRKPITVTLLDELAQAGELALDNPALGASVVTVSNPRPSGLDFLAKVKPPGADEQSFALTRNYINWVNQALDPAHLKDTT
jgi:hypothetical protein